MFVLVISCDVLGISEHNMRHIYPVTCNIWDDSVIVFNREAL